VRVVGDDDHRVLGKEAVRSTAGREQHRELAVGLGQRVDLSLGPVAVRVVVVVGQRQQQEVEQVMRDEVGTDATGVAVAHARQAERAVAARRAAREDVGVEQLARPEHRPAHQRAGGDPCQQRLAVRLVRVAPAVHQVGGAGGAQSMSSSCSNTVSVSAARCSPFML
jgi:hypothetical protein